MRSIWKDYAEEKRFSKLTDEIKTEVLIIGGGMAGLLSAYKLTKNGVKCVIIEKGKILSGVTENTTAKVTAQHNLIYSKIRDKYGLEASELYLSANLDAVKEYKELGKNIDCDMEEADSYVYTLGAVEKLEKEAEVLRQINYKPILSKAEELPFEDAYALGFPSQAHINPLKLGYSLASGLEIYEDTPSISIKEHCVITEYGKIYADHIIIATHFPIIDKHGLFFLKMYQERSYVMAIRTSEKIKGMYIDENKDGISIRPYRDMLLIGGGARRGGDCSGGYKAVSDFISKKYPKSEIVTKFSTQDCITLDGIPYIGRYYKKSKGLYVTSGFNKWGMTSSMVSANLLSDIILGKKSPYEDLFNPSRSIMHIRSIKNTFKAVISIVTPTSPRCSHLGCALKYNKSERVWECPCHGSRFNEDMQVIDNPAEKNLKEKK